MSDAMNCFTHRSLAAVGICKSCGKALCPDCAADTGHGLACKNACEARVLLTNQIVECQARVLRVANAQVRTAGVFTCVIGLMILVLAGSSYVWENLLLAIFFGVFGVVFTSFGLFRFFAQRYPTLNG